MTIRNVALVLLAGLAGCSGSGSAATQPEKSEETQAAYVLHGLVDQAMLFTNWVEQTSTSPAVFQLHSDGGVQQDTFTVTKADKCKYQIHIERKGGSEDGAVVDMVKDLSGVDVDKAPPRKLHDMVASIPGLAGSCTVSAGKSQACSNVGADQTMLPFGFALGHEKEAIKAFTARFCR
ncbi:exported hypothetical protein [Mesorhizobium plurifarium]|uniref:Lipoprotein n=1 Tax=Mesorhizobium plurifarium TaxID=69974 RepID=A0A090FR19_MESPL|nr:exported hypothetical protein [Mesorhizobium plurifarium]